MIITHYDEFEIYTILEDIESTIESLLEHGMLEINEIYHKCIDTFGFNHYKIIKQILKDK